MFAELKDTFPATEEIFCLARPQRIQVIIEIKIFLVQSIYTMQMHFDRIAVKGRKIVLRDYITVKHNLEILCIRLLRHLRSMRYYKVYIPYERHVDFDSSQEIFQCTPIPETLLHYRNVRIFLIILFPYRIVSVYICNYYIHSSIVFQKFPQYI